MDKPAYVISSKTGERILNWCNQGTSLDEVIKMVQQAKDVVELRDLLTKYPEYRKTMDKFMAENPGITVVDLVLVLIYKVALEH